MSENDVTLQPDSVVLGIRSELSRIEEDCIHSGKAHFNAGERWTKYHYWLGIPSIILSTAAGAAFLKDLPEIAGAMSSGAALLTALMTFLKPSEKASSHKSSGDQYLTLRNDARVLRTIKLVSSCDHGTAVSYLDEITKRRNELNQATQQVSRRDFEKARQGINAGEATHQVDHEAK